MQLSANLFLGNYPVIRFHRSIPHRGYGYPVIRFHLIVPHAIIRLEDRTILGESMS